MAPNGYLHLRRHETALEPSKWHSAGRAAVDTAHIDSTIGPLGEKRPFDLPHSLSENVFAGVHVDGHDVKFVFRSQFPLETLEHSLGRVVRVTNILFWLVARKLHFIQHRNAKAAHQRL